MDAPSAVLATKFEIPRARRRIVERARLDDRMRRSLDSPLTLVSAPPGFGKTTLVAGWAHRARAQHDVAWLSLDQADSDAAVFWPLLIKSLGTAVHGIAEQPIAALGSQSIEVLLVGVLNELAANRQELVVVLDDYHMVDRPAISEAMTFLLDHLPRQVHVVITTRADPVLPLARLRARGELVEIRAMDLRFTREEAATYLESVMGLDLSADDAAALEARTEGWIAALQLAATSMQGRADAPAFVAAFEGTDRYVVDYLVDEVLARQPPDIRAFLLHTSVLDRLNGSLCDALTGRHDSHTVLEFLDRAHDHVVRSIPAGNHGTYSTKLQGFFVVCSGDGIVSGSCVPSWTNVGGPDPLPFATTVNGRPLTSASAIESAAAAGLVVPINLGPSAVIVGSISGN